MKHLYYLAVLCIVALTASCSKESIQSSDTDRRIPATVRATNGATRAAWNGTQSLWEEGDKINLAVETASPPYYNQNREFTISKIGDDARSATFEGTLANKVSGEQVVWAAYPYYLSTNYSSAGYFYCSINISKQTHRADGGYKFPLMLGYFKGDVGENLSNVALNFKCPLVTLKLNIKVTEETTFKTISFMGNNNEKIDYPSIHLNTDGEASFFFDNFDARTQITLDCGNLEVKAGNTATFYISIPPREYTKGYTINITTVNGYAVKVNSTSLDYTAKQNTIINMPELTPDFTELITGRMPDAMLRSALKEKGYIKDVTDEVVMLTPNGILAKTINISNSNITSIEGIDIFPYLTSLTCSGNNMSSLDLSKYNKLTEIDCSKNPNLTSLTLPEETGVLTDLTCNNCNLSALDLSKHHNLAEIDCSNNPNLTSLKLSDSDDSENVPLGYTRSVNCSYCNLSTLDMSKTPYVSILYCSNNPNLTSLTLREGEEFMGLGVINCSYCNLLSLDMSVLGFFPRTVKCNNNPNLTSLKLPSFEYNDGDRLTFDCSNCPLLSQLELPKTINGILEDFNCSNCNLSSLDIIPSTEYLYFFANLFNFYVGNQNTTNGNSGVLELTTPQALKQRWDGVLKNDERNANVNVTYVE